jgi:hypothetical protein
VLSSSDQQEHMTRPSDTAEPADPPAVSIACPSCRRLVPVGAACPHCGQSTGSLLLDRGADGANGPDRPDEAAASVAAEHSDDRVGAHEPADATVVLPPVPERTAELDLTQIPADVPPAPPAAPAPPTSPATARPQGSAATPRRALAVAGGAAALLLVGAAAVAGLRSGSADAGGAGSPASGTGAAADAVPVDPATVRASASSTQRADGAVSYAAGNTLDGRPQTAWNSHGQGVGASLTYTFASPVDLRSVTVLNGYQKVRRGHGGGTVDLYALNDRVKTFTVVTDAGRVPWNLRDDRTPQTLTHGFGRTRTVRLEVTGIYPSAKYHDLAVSDVTFGAAP